MSEMSYTIRAKGYKPFKITNGRDGSDKVEYASDADNYLEASFDIEEVDYGSEGPEFLTFAKLCFVVEADNPPFLLPSAYESGLLDYEGVVTRDVAKILRTRGLRRLNSQFVSHFELDRMVIYGYRGENGQLTGRFSGFPVNTYCCDIEKFDVQCSYFWFKGGKFETAPPINVQFNNNNDSNIFSVRCDGKTGNAPLEHGIVESVYFVGNHGRIKHFYVETAVDLVFGENFMDRTHRAESIEVVGGGNVEVAGAYVEVNIPSVNADKLRVVLRRSVSIGLFFDRLNEYATGDHENISQLEIELGKWSDAAALGDALGNLLNTPNGEMSYLRIKAPDVSFSEFGSQFFNSAGLEVMQHFLSTICYFSLDLANDDIPVIVGFINSLLSYIIAEYETPRSRPEREINFYNTDVQCWNDQQLQALATDLSNLVSPNIDDSAAPYWTITTPTGSYYQGVFTPTGV